MPIVRSCSVAGCSTLTMGIACLQCETEGRAHAEGEVAEALAARLRPSAPPPAPRP